MGRQTLPEGFDAKIEAAKELHPKSYNESNSSDEDITIIRNTIFEFEPNIVYWYETTIQSKFSIEVQRERTRELIKDFDYFIYIIDLTRAQKPDAATRDHLKGNFQFANLSHTVIFTGSNLLLNMAAKFVLSSVFGQQKFEVYKEREMALNVAREYARKCRNAA